MTSKKILLVGFLAVLCVGLTQLGWSAAIDPSSKIASRVMSETSNGGSTEALVVLSTQADLSAAANLPTKLAKGKFVVSTLQSVANRTQGPIIAMLQKRGISYQAFWIINMIKVTGDRNLMEALAVRNDVARIDANPKVHVGLPAADGDDTSFQPQGIEWNIQRVKAPDVWALGFHGEGLVVAGNDTGIQWDHPALKNHYRGWDGQQANHDYNWHDAVSHSLVPNDPHGHGTFTISEAVGDDGQGNQIGVAPGAKWIGCRNMDSGGNGTPAWYTDCFQWLIAPTPVGGGQGDPSKAPDSINNSWECPPSEGCSPGTLQTIVEAVRAAGIFPAMAAGNSGPQCSTIAYPPAIYDASVDVAALDSSNGIASFSSRGPVTSDGSHRVKPDVSAPGVNIRGAVPGNGYGSGWSGTSMAAPHLAGAVALLWQAKPSLIGNISQTASVFEHSALHLVTHQAAGFCKGPSFQKDNTFGYGLLNILAAVQAQ